MIWGDPIEVGGVRPAWLGGHCDRIGYKRSSDPEWFGPDDDMPNLWSESDITENAPGWSNVEAIRLPATHPAYLAIAKGFEPWAGGDSAPEDWDGGDVLLRGGSICSAKSISFWGDSGQLNDIIGYKKRQTEVVSDDTVTVKRMTKNQFHSELLSLNMNVEEWLNHVGIILPPTQFEIIAQKTGLTVDQVQSVLNEVCHGTR